MPEPVPLTQGHALGTVGGIDVGDGAVHGVENFIGSVGQKMRASRNGRFAAGPSGALHVGNARTALLAWVFARSTHDSFYVRMEDLDVRRVGPGAEEAQLADLAALARDESGPAHGGTARPSAQAQGPTTSCTC